MAKIKSTDVIHAEILEESVRSAVTAGLICLLGTGAVVAKSGLSESGMGARGKKVQIPYFGSLGDMEDVAADGDALTPAPAVSTVEESVVQHSGKAFELTMFAQQGVDDPYAEFARQVKEAAQRRFDKALLTAALGADVPMTNTTGATISYDTLVDTKMLFGEEQDNMAAYCMHSRVVGRAMKIKDANGLPLFTDARDGGLPRILGVPVITSDILVPTGNVYPTLLVKKGALALWYNENITVGTDKDILADSLVTAVHVYFAAHKYKHLGGRVKPGVAILKTTEA